MTFEQLTEIVGALAASVVARDNQLDALTNITRELSVTTHELSITTRELSITASKHDAQIGQLVEFSKNLKESFANMERQWQAYLNTLPRN